VAKPIIRLLPLSPEILFFILHKAGYILPKVSNLVATQLTLVSDKIKYVASPQFAESSPPYSENSLQQNDKSKLSFVYPNPAKNILHVQTYDNASFSLLDQTGKTFFS
jgi:hypothetical protein